ncbi:glycosyltransferase family 2 protein [Salinigranum salinum]|uniref:glycosyltransferase family 2 protein n=1 Tax=Salinigranum salinum TaxID=1364937 RepID=UPI0012603EE4|nr:glycosyltransferase family 2 protein [Salinigranum salinum]
MTSSGVVTTPLVSIIIPTYYRNDLLKQTIESAEAQTHDAVEIIVVDDSGEGHAEEAVTGYDDVNYIALDRNQGPQRARTAGIERARGEYVQLLDDDDRLHEDKFEKQIPLLQGNDDVGVAYSGFKWEGGPTVLPKQHIRGNVLKHALMFDTAPCITSTMLIERDTLTEILPLANRSGADDTGIKIELAQLTEFDYVDEALVCRTETQESRHTSAGKLNGQWEILSDYRDLYDRYPDTVYRKALAETYLVEGMHLLDEHVWSPRAISATAKACYYIPNFSLPIVGAFLASLFGRPGRDVALRVFRSRNQTGQRGKRI